MWAQVVYNIRAIAKASLNRAFNVYRLVNVRTRVCRLLKIPERKIHKARRDVSVRVWLKAMQRREKFSFLATNATASFPTHKSLETWRREEDKSLYR